jgi:hypothetical protein
MLCYFISFFYYQSFPIPFICMPYCPFSPHILATELDIVQVWQELPTNYDYASPLFFTENIYDGILGFAI